MCHKLKITTHLCFLYYVIYCKNGILSSKLAYIISLLENTSYGLSAIKSSASNQVMTLKYATSTDSTFTVTCENGGILIGFKPCVRQSGSADMYITVYVDDISIYDKYNEYNDSYIYTYSGIRFKEITFSRSGGYGATQKWELYYCE